MLVRLTIAPFEILPLSPMTLFFFSDYQSFPSLMAFYADTVSTPNHPYLHPTPPYFPLRIYAPLTVNFTPLLPPAPQPWIQ